MDSQRLSKTRSSVSSAITLISTCTVNADAAHLSIVLLDHRQQLLVLLQSLLHNRVAVLVSLDQSAQDAFVRRRILHRVIVDACT